MSYFHLECAELGDKIYRCIDVLFSLHVVSSTLSQNAMISSRKWNRIPHMSVIGALLYLVGLGLIHRNLEVKVRSYISVVEHQDIVIVQNDVIRGRYQTSTTLVNVKTRKVPRAAKSKIVNLSRDEYRKMINTTCHNESIGLPGNIALCKCFPLLSKLLGWIRIYNI